MDWKAITKGDLKVATTSDAVERYERETSLSDKIINFTPTLHSLISAFLKVILAGFICFLTYEWFYFMKSTVNFYLYHYHILEKSAPESVIIATITLGATITGLMVIILKGLFGTK
ncbi:hypothetical protein BVJ63_18745 [Vibrio cholerae]|uniref:hypothetical protein n=1 Tax=Vibrio TaxID=662 RepID=UPI0012ADDB2D|nr:MULTISPECIES: hypothetical protein [Vibrio]EJL6763120.1 hypothetical protein [Vibrio cholerae]ELI0351303.1 hypothetical protein [Vibrio vulnificus]MBO1383000.1 hypothetical protein [Vibrio cholerae]MBO1390521.1 hypothetical protein [Vibrio cholerae]MBO1397982.1 hypothetical protein [Vibrio cholerae]